MRMLKNILIFTAALFVVSGVVLAVTLVSGSSWQIFQITKPKSAEFRFTDHLVINGMDT